MTALERPQTVAEARRVLRESTGTVLFRGGGTKLDWAGLVQGPDTTLDTTRLAGMLTHNPADMTASVRAGTTLEDLQAHLAGDGQWLALDPPTAPEGATVGGLLAAGDSGPSRLRYGSLRDLVIGVTLVLADGTVARSGGHVIKNVAGYDLAKLMYGSLGSLALVAEVVVRLHPRPRASLTTSVAAPAGQATAATLAIAADPLEPAAVEWVSGGDSGQLYIRIDGSQESVEASGQRLHQLLAGLGLAPCSLTAAEAEAAWHAHRLAVLGHEADTVVRLSDRPSSLDQLATLSFRTAQECGLEAVLVSSAALGLHTVRLSGGTPPDHARAVTSLRTAALAHGASVLLRRRVCGLDSLLDTLGPPPSSIEVLRQIKAQFDPGGRCAPGRFRPWY